MSMHPDDSLPSGDRAEQAGAWCLRLAADGLSEHERAEFDAWLTADTANARAFDAAARAWEALDRASTSPELIAMRRNALDRFRRGHTTRWRRGRAGRRGVLALAAFAACLAIAAVGIGLWMHYAPQSYETGLGERRIVALNDGSRISLDAASRVKVRYGDGRRQLWLEQGRAKFAVARDPLRPFSVAAADKVVVATGTEFSVELLADRVHVILYEGGVDVLSGLPGGKALQPVEIPDDPAVPGEPAAQVLVPGSEMVARIATAVARVESADPVRSLAWEAGQLAFADEPLASAVERMNRYADRPLAIGDDAAGRVRISGVFAAGDTEAFVEGVTGVFPVRTTVDDGHQVFVSAR